MKTENRVLNKAREWEKIKQENIDVYGPRVANSKWLMRDQLKFYRVIRREFDGRKDLTPVEKTSYRLLKEEIKNLKTMAYSSRLHRFMSEAFDKAKDLAIGVHTHRKETKTLKTEAEVNAELWKTALKNTSIGNKNTSGQNKNGKPRPEADNDSLLPKVKAAQNNGIHR